jgi:hypothetical protein
LRSLGSFLVCLAALLPIFQWVPLRRSLRWYLLITAIHGFLQGLILAFGFPVSSVAFIAEWYGARVAQLVFAVLFASEITDWKHRILAGGIASVLFGLVGASWMPTVWYNWLNFGYSFLITSIGLAIVGASTGRIMGLYWIATGAYYCAFLRLSTDPLSRIWSVNYWLPSAISIIAFLTLGFAGWSPSRSRPPGDL